jgi:Uma2 family endonuclease
MALLKPDITITRDEFLAGELVSEMKHEFIDGRVYAMSGGSMNHQRIGRNFSNEAGQGLKGKGCEPSNSDFLLRIPLIDHKESFYYPDGMIICTPVPGDAQYTDSPTVILEVLSPSTRRTDEVQKFRAYLTIPSLQVYLLAETEEPTIRIYRRQGDQFIATALSGLDATLDLPEVGLSIPLSEIYRDVEFPLPE